MNTRLVEAFGGETVVDEYPNCRRRSLSHLVVTVLL